MQLQAQQWIILPERHDMCFACLKGLMTIGSTGGAALSMAFPKRDLSPSLMACIVPPPVHSSYFTLYFPRSSLESLKYRLGDKGTVLSDDNRPQYLRGAVESTLSG